MSTQRKEESDTPVRSRGPYPSGECEIQLMAPSPGAGARPPQGGETCGPGGFGSNPGAARGVKPLDRPIQNS